MLVSLLFLIDSAKASNLLSLENHWKRFLITHLRGNHDLRPLCPGEGCTRSTSQMLKHVVGVKLREFPPHFHRWHFSSSVCRRKWPGQHLRPDSECVHSFFFLLSVSYNRKKKKDTNVCVHSLGWNSFVLLSNATCVNNYLRLSDLIRRHVKHDTSLWKQTVNHKSTLIHLKLIIECKRSCSGCYFTESYLEEKNSTGARSSRHNLSV